MNQFFKFSNNSRFFDLVKEYGDKLPADKKGPIEDAVAELKKSHEAKDFEGMKANTEKLNTIFQAASQEMYAQQEAGAQPEGDAGTEKGEDEVTDVDFEEVTEETAEEEQK